MCVLRDPSATCCLAIFTFLFLNSTGWRAAAQGASVTNADVVQMIDAGLSEPVVINAIRTAPTRQFDLSTQGLIGLKKAGVPDAVIAEMQKNLSVANAAQDRPQIAANAPFVAMLPGKWTERPKVPNEPPFILTVTQIAGATVEGTVEAPISTGKNAKPAYLVGPFSGQIERESSLSFSAVFANGTVLRQAGLLTRGARLGCEMHISGKVAQTPEGDIEGSITATCGRQTEAQSVRLAKIK